MSSRTTFRILSLDGGGAKGFYTLGVLREVEALLGRPLCDSFDLIFGTSTGAIIAALLATGKSVANVHKIYRAYVPVIMRHRTVCGRSKALDRLAEKVFRKKDFSSLKTGLGVVATHWNLEKPMIFKGSVAQAHGRDASFVPGFGCTLAEAVKASCSAYPYFKRVRIETTRRDSFELFDGGYCANNPTLYAIADALNAFKRNPADLRVLSIGVGIYPEPKRFVKKAYEFPVKALIGFTGIQLLQKTLDVNTTSMEQLRKILFGDIQTVRINDRFEQPELATDLMESDLRKLGLLFQRGVESYAERETAIRDLLAIVPGSRSAGGVH